MHVGISTHLFHHQPLAERHLEVLAAATWAHALEPAPAHLRIVRRRPVGPGLFQRFAGVGRSPGGARRDGCGARGGAPEAVDVLAGHPLTTHVHDNRGREDEHLVPFTGTVDWPATLMALSKVGFTGPLGFEVPDHGDVDRTVRRLIAVRDRIRAILDDLAQPFNFADD